MKFSVKYLKEFIIEQRFIPYRIEKALKVNYPMLYLLWHYGNLTANTRKYWNKIWTKENINTWRIYPQLFSEIVKIIPPRSKVLDIGCGVGMLLKRLKEEKECECNGIDISDFAIAVVKNQGINGRVSKLPIIPYSDDTFDVVIATEILEHIKKINKTIAEALRVLKKNGLLIISVPDNCLGFDEQDEHFHKFSRESLENLLVQFGTILRIQTMRFEIIKGMGRIGVEKKILALLQKD